MTGLLKLVCCDCNCEFQNFNSRTLRCSSCFWKYEEGLWRMIEDNEMLKLQESSKTVIHDWKGEGF